MGDTGSGRWIFDVLQRVSFCLVVVPGIAVRAVEGQVAAGGDVDEAAPAVVPPPSVERVIVHALAPRISVVRVARAWYHGTPGCVCACQNARECEMNRMGLGWLLCWVLSD